MLCAPTIALFIVLQCVHSATVKFLLHALLTFNTFTLYHWPAICTKNCSYICLVPFIAIASLPSTIGLYIGHCLQHTLCTFMALAPTIYHSIGALCFYNTISLYGNRRPQCVQIKDYSYIALYLYMHCAP